MAAHGACVNDSKIGKYVSLFTVDTPGTTELHHANSNQITGSILSEAILGPRQQSSPQTLCYNVSCSDLSFAQPELSPDPYHHQIRQRGSTGRYSVTMAP